MRVYLKAPGINTRAEVGLYLRATILVMLILLVTAIAIDLAANMSGITDKAQQTGVARLSILAPYLLYRSVDIVTRLLPQACFLGVFMAEILRARRFERVILALSGASPLRGLSAILLFSLLAGSVQGINEIWLRPAAVFAQIDLGVGAYGRRFRPGLRNTASWFIIGNDALRARLVTGAAAEMRDVELFRGIDRQRLTSVVMAARAVPGDRPGQWRLGKVVTWTRDPGKASYTPKFEETAIMSIAINPAEVIYNGVAPYFLGQRTLQTLAAIPGRPMSDDANVALWRRYTAILLPGVFAFLGAGLAQIGYPGRREHMPLLIGLAVFGYLSIVSVKVFWALGEQGVLSPPVAVMASVLFALAIGVLVQIMQVLPRARLHLWQRARRRQDLTNPRGPR